VTYHSLNDSKLSHTVTHLVVMLVAWIEVNWISYDNKVY